MTLTLYTNPMSRGRIAHWMMEELSQPYEVTYLDYGTTMKAPEYLAINPMGKVPALVHDGKVVTECAAICLYVADAFPDAGMMGEDRASFYRWMLFAAGPLEHAVTNKAFSVKFPAEREGTIGYGNFDQTMQALDTAVSKTKFIAGDRFSAADVYVGSQIGWGLQFGTIPETEALRSYWNRIKDRPARLRADAADDALIPKKPE
ncbi:glutathione S-transferase family protein [Pseudorhodobacter sp.]|uniref:glutathione S-transferase family protein n=1 Tax=Pseudorhodobacter sp. TaxID=1934400 RepID=UPI002647BB36|nr:glutathione S-transferase family protein [Pseudorhodobacter sp.]MDN5786548.1 glutathione S-transferase family protein [Pseudorhodobacter sp.]